MSTCLTRRTAASLTTALAVLAILLAGCEGPTSPVPEHGLQLAFGNADWDPIEGRAGVVSTGRGRITIGGRIPAGNPCQDLRGETLVGAGTLDLRITARQLDSPCIAVIAVFPYLAVKEGLASGSYRVRVQHAYENTGWSGTIVLDTTVVVP